MATLIKFIGLPVYSGYLISNYLNTGNIGTLVGGIATGIFALIIKIKKRGDVRNGNWGCNK